MYLHTHLKYVRVFNNYYNLYSEQSNNSELAYVLENIIEANLHNTLLSLEHITKKPYYFNFILSKK